MQGDSKFVNRCSFVDRDCDSSIVLRTTRITGSDQVIDTMLFAQEASPNVSVNPTRNWPVRGSGAIVCYSGLQDTFGQERDRVFPNHAALIIAPLVLLFRQHLFLGFDAPDPVSRNVLRAVERMGIAATNVLEEPRNEEGRQLMPVKPGGGNDSVTQYVSPPARTTPGR